MRLSGVPAEAIWVVMKQPDGHAVLDALNDSPEGSPRVENTYAKTTHTAVLYRPYSDLSCRLGAGTSVEGRCLRSGVYFFSKVRALSYP